MRSAALRRGWWVLWGILRLATAFAAAAPGPLPLTVSVETTELDSATRVTLTFSRSVEYRLEESRSRLKLLLQEPLADVPFSRRELDGGLVKQIRIEPAADQTEITFYLGREFENFSQSESDKPFKIQLLFQKKGAPPQEATNLESPPETPAEPSGIGQPTETPGGESQTAGVEAAMGSIVIDPGHGGDESGATGRGGLAEKTLVLDVARRLRDELERSGHPARLTRDEDSAVELTARTALANHLRAPLFLSIHANASVRDGARGAETYFLAVSGIDDEAAAIARGENASVRDAGVPDSASGEIRLVLWEMAQAEHLARSSRLAEIVQDELNQVTGQKDRGVKQAPFRVLVGATMPAALVELGFLSNPAEESQLATEAYRQKVAGALATAVRRFLDESGAAGSNPSGSNPASPGHP